VISLTLCSSLPPLKKKELALSGVNQYSHIWKSNVLMAGMTNENGWLLPAWKFKPPFY
jgi:hypothetical protein